MKISRNNLTEFCIRAMIKCGMTENDARTTAKVLVETDFFGVHTHGSKQLYLLLKNVLQGGINSKASPAISIEGTSWAIVDGNNAMPMVTATKSMDTAISKAKNSGIAFVGAKRSSHFGAAGYYANMAAKQNMIGIAMSNVDPCMTVPGGKTPVIGTNPIAYAAPYNEQRTIFLDIATSITAASKIFIAKAAGKKIPDGWLVDRDGLPTNDPSLFPNEGAMLPMAGHKGYGIAILIEILSAVLTGAMFTLDVAKWWQQFDMPVNQGHCFIAIDITKMIDIAEFKSRMEKLACQIHKAPKAKDSERIYLPGEIEWDKYEKNIKQGVELPGDVVTNLKKISEELKIELSQC